MELLEVYNDNFLISDKKFLFAKVNIHGNIFSANLDQLIQHEIPRVIKSANDYRLKNSTISFTDVQQVTVNQRRVIIGHLTYSKRESLRYKDGPKTYMSKTEKEVANSALFIYDIDSEILSFTTTNKINSDTFIKYFTTLLSQDDLVGQVKIKIIPEKYDIIRQIKQLDKVTYLRFSLIHPNPGNRHYNLYKEIIKNTSAKEVDVTFRDEKDGLELSDIDSTDDKDNKIHPISDGLDMIEAGYGDIEIKGVNISYIESGTKRKTKKKIEKRRMFNSKTSYKTLTLNKINSKDAINKVINHITEFFL